VPPTSVPPSSARPAPVAERAGPAPSTASQEATPSPSATPAPASPSRTVVTTVGASTITFTYPANVPPEHQPIYDAYFGYRTEVSARLGSPVEPNYSAFVGRELEADYRTWHEEIISAGQTYSGAVRSSPVLARESGASALIVDCVMDEVIGTDRDGVVFSPVAARPMTWEVVMHRRSGGGWEAAGFLVTGEPCEG
jgi:hypothetical protein